jgi:anthranilate synthase component II
MSKILLIDNYDSFTYNVVHSLSAPAVGVEVEVIRNDQISISEISERIDRNLYTAIVISPGPGRPSDSGISMDLIREIGVKKEIPLLGICLGHQAIGEVFGGDVILAPTPVHGKPTQIYHQNKGVFEDLPSPFQTTRYHSLIVDRQTLPSDLLITAWTEDEIIMGLQHKEYHWIQGIQFHPESILTDVLHREKLFNNFLKLVDTDYPFKKVSSHVELEFDIFETQ